MRDTKKILEAHVITINEIDKLHTRRITELEQQLTTTREIAKELAEALQMILDPVGCNNLPKVRKALAKAKVVGLIK